jgi:GNAT superfamily N-acetyltransferase
MKKYLGKETLKSGETMEIYNVVAPAGNYGLDLVDFIHGRGPFPADIPWHRYCQRAWQGAFANEVLVSWQVGELDGKVVGLVGYSTPLATLDVCTWSHVVTQVEQRGKNIATLLTRHSIEDFKTRGGQAMYLGTGRTGGAHRVYEKNGFRDYQVGTTGVIMQLEIAESFTERYFAPTEPLHIGELHIADMPRLEALINQPHWGVKSYSEKAIGPHGYEGQFLELWERLENGTSTCRTLRGPQEQLFGAAWTSPSSLPTVAEDVRIFDFIIHPHAQRESATLLAEQLKTESGKRLVAYTAGPDTIRRTALLAAGFTLAASPADPIDLDEQRVALDAWHLHR